MEDNVNKFIIKSNQTILILWYVLIWKSLVYFFMVWGKIPGIEAGMEEESSPWGCWLYLAAPPPVFVGFPWGSDGKESTPAMQEA